MRQSKIRKWDRRRWRRRGTSSIRWIRLARLITILGSNAKWRSIRGGPIHWISNATNLRNAIPVVNADAVRNGWNGRDGRRLLLRGNGLIAGVGARLVNCVSKQSLCSKI